MTDKWLLVLGAKSDIARATAERFAFHGFNLLLAARKCHLLDDTAREYEKRYGVQAKSIEFDVLDFGSHPGFYSGLGENVCGVLCAVGYVGAQNRSGLGFEETRRIIDVNFTGCVSILDVVAADFEKRKGGFIIGISSVAGDRGRSSNYHYGSAKAAFTAYLSGLRNRLFTSGVFIMTVKPGFVATSMTRNLDLPPLLVSQPSDVADDIFRAWKRRRDVIYTKWFWKYIMIILAVVPEKLFKRLSI